MSQNFRESRTLYPSSNLVRKREMVNIKNPFKASISFLYKDMILNKSVEKNILSRDFNINLMLSKDKRKRSHTI
jgi:hypothetical protein